MAKKMFPSEIERMEALSSELTSVSDGEKLTREALDALLANIEAMIRDVDVSLKNSDTANKDIELPGMETLYEKITAVADMVVVMLSSVKTSSETAKAVYADMETLSVKIDTVHKDIEAIFKHLEAESKELLDLHVRIEAMSADEMAKFLCKQGISPNSFFVWYMKMIDMISNLNRVPLNLRGILLGYEAICKSMRFFRKGKGTFSKHTSDEIHESVESIYKKLDDISAAEKATLDSREIIHQELNILFFKIQVLSKILRSVTLDIRMMHLCVELMYQGMSAVSQNMPDALREVNAVLESLNFFLLRPIAMQIHN